MLSSIDNVSMRFLMPSSLQSSMADSCASVGVRIALFLTQSAKPTHSLVVANKKARDTFLYSSTIDYLYFTISSHLLSAFLVILTEFRPYFTVKLSTFRPHFMETNVVYMAVFLTDFLPTFTEVKCCIFTAILKAFC